MLNTSESGRKAYLIGGGIASLAAAAFLIRDGKVSGSDITIIDASPKPGGSLDASGSAEGGYVMRGGRMLESRYRCTFDLFSTIPTLDGSRSVTEEIVAWNRVFRTCSRSRFFSDGRRQDSPKFNLGERHIATIERLGITPEWALGRTTIADHFDAKFFTTDFWLMWCTTFAFQPWHGAVEFKRYLLRFMHMVSGFPQLKGILRTMYNQYDSMVRPLQHWLQSHGVNFAMNTRVTDLKFLYRAEGYSVENIEYRRDGWHDKIHVDKEDYVFVTLGSMTESSSFGSMTRAPELKGQADQGAWALWKKIAAGRPQFGHPENFSEQVDRSKWISFTVTLKDPTFFHRIRDLTGNVPGEGGLITFPKSSWLLSIALPHQPHFIGQPEGVQVFWGYGLFADVCGDFTTKPMSACSGREIMMELLGHLGLQEDAPAVLSKCNVIPCMMPYITSQFLCRSRGDRPQVIPERSKNMAFIGQFCELPDEVVFTVEYSVRSAQDAVYSLLGLDRSAPAIYQGKYDPRVLLKASLALHDVG